MRTSPSFLLLAVLLASGAQAQAQAQAQEVMAPARADVELSDAAELSQGGLILTPRDFFLLAGRTDLVERSDRNLLTRRWLIGSAIAVGVAAVVVGSVILALTPNIEKPYCLSTLAHFSECSDYIQLYEKGGITTILGGVAVAALLATLGWWSNPGVLSWRELLPVVTAYNAGLHGPP